MKTMAEKAREYVEKSFLGILTQYQQEPWPKLKEALVDIYMEGAVEALLSQWHEPEDIHDCMHRNVLVIHDCMHRNVLVVYESFYKGRYLTITTVNSVKEWTQDKDLIHPDDELVKWMAIPTPPDDAEIIEADE